MGVVKVVKVKPRRGSQGSSDVPLLPQQSDLSSNASTSAKQVTSSPPSRPTVRKPKIHDRVVGSGTGSAIVTMGSARPDFSQFLPADDGIADLPEAPRTELIFGAALPQPPQPSDPSDGETPSSNHRSPSSSAIPQPSPTPSPMASPPVSQACLPTRIVPSITATQPANRSPLGGDPGSAVPTQRSVPLPVQSTSEAAPAATTSVSPPRATVPLAALLGTSPDPVAATTPTLPVSPERTADRSSTSPPTDEMQKAAPQSTTTDVADSQLAAPQQPQGSSKGSSALGRAAGALGSSLRSIVSTSRRGTQRADADPASPEQLRRLAGLTREAHVKLRDIRLRDEQFGERLTERQLAGVFGSLSQWVDALLPIAALPAAAAFGELLPEHGSPHRGSGVDADVQRELQELRGPVAELVEFYLALRLRHPGTVARCLSGPECTNQASGESDSRNGNSLRRPDDDVAAALLIFLRDCGLLCAPWVDPAALAGAANAIGEKMDNWLCTAYLLDATVDHPRLPLPRGYLPHPASATHAHLVSHLWRPLTGQERDAVSATPDAIPSRLIALDADTVGTLQDGGGLCNVLWYLPYLFAVGTAKAMHLCVALYPQVGWKNVRGATSRGVQRAAHEALQMPWDHNREALLQDLYLDYLMILSQTHRDVCKAQPFVAQYLSVLLHSIALIPIHRRRQEAGSAAAAAGPPRVSDQPFDSSTLLEEKKLRRREDIIRDIIANPGVFTYDAEEVAALFMKHSYFQGLLLLRREKQYITTLLQRNQLNLLFEYFQNQGREREEDWREVLHAVYAMKREQERQQRQRRGENGSAQHQSAASAASNASGLAGPLERVAYIMCVCLGATRSMELLSAELNRELQYDAVLQNIHKKFAIIAHGQSGAPCASPRHTGGMAHLH